MQQKLPDANEFAVAVNALAVVISRGLTPSEQNILGNLLTLLGASVLFLAAVNQFNQQSGSQDSASAAETTGTDAL